MEPVRRLKLSASVAAELERMLKHGDYEVGEKLPPERLLAEQLGVGRSSMREALRLVEADGLVRTEHGIGVFVASKVRRRLSAPSDLLVLDGFTIPELFEVRLALEVEAAELAARRLTRSEAAELKRIVADAADPALSDEGFIKRDAELHMTIVKATKNTLLVGIFRTIEPLFFAYSERVIQLEGRRATARAGHEDIVRAIVARRPGDARNSMLKHLHAVEREIRNHLEEFETRRTGKDAKFVVVDE